MNAASDIDLRLDHTDNSEAQVDASVLTLAAVFGPVAFPAGMPNYHKQAILDRADRERDAAGDLVIDNRLNPTDPRQRQAKADATMATICPNSRSWSGRSTKNANARNGRAPNPPLAASP